jgi:general secretion pathway protein N
MKKRYVFILCCSVILSIVVINAPAIWLSSFVWHYSKGLISLERTWGTVWQGTTQIRIHRSEKETLLMPEAITWHLTLNRQNTVLNAVISLQSAALSTPVQLVLSSTLDNSDKSLINKRFTDKGLIDKGFIDSLINPAILIQLSSGQYQLPIDSLSYLGAPFNTIKPSGQASLAWSRLTHLSSSRDLPVVDFRIGINQLRTLLTGTMLLGHYNLLATSERNTGWLLTLKTRGEVVPLETKLILSGTGKLFVQGGASFELRAKGSTPTVQEQLSTLLSFLGRKEGDEYVLRIQ